MQAIQTKYFGPTNSRGSRIKAECAAKTIFVPYDHALDIDENHLCAALQLADALKWISVYGIGFGRAKEMDWFQTGTLKDGSFVHVLVSK